MNRDQQELSLSDFGDRMLQAKKVLITTHKSPDGDGFGCLLALAGVLREKGREVSVVTVGEIAPRFRFLPGAKDVLDWEAMSEQARKDALVKPELIVVVDTHKFSMLGQLGDTLRSEKTPIIFLDHHANDQDIPGGFFLDADSSSAGEITYRLLKEMDVSITPETATCLYTAITYDTNSFKYLRQRGETLRVAGALIDAGADANEIYRHIFASNSQAKMKLIGRSLNDIQIDGGGLIAWTTVSQKLMQDTGAQPDDMRELITYLLEIDSVEIAITFKDRGTGNYKVSLRSKGRYPVRDIAVALGGGGHLFAAGGEATGEFDEVVERVLAMVRQKLPKPVPAGGN